MEPTSIGLNSEPAAPTSDQIPAPTLGESADPSLSNPSAGEPTEGANQESPVESIDHKHVATLAKGLTKEQKAALLPELLQDGDINAPFQSNVDKAANRLAQERIQQLQLANEHNDAMATAEQQLAALLQANPSQYARAKWDNEVARQVSNGTMDSTGFADLENQVLAWRRDKTQAPTRNIIYQEAIKDLGQRADKNLMTALSSDEELRSLVDWEKALTFDGPPTEERTTGMLVGVMKQMRRAIERQVRAELAPKVQADIADGVAARTEGLPEPTANSAGIVSSGVGGLQALMNRAADPTQNLSAQEWAQVREARDRGIYPKLAVGTR